MNPRKKKYDYGIVITGNIGSGKSSVCKILKDKGYAIIDADKINHEILDSLSSEIKELFGEEFVVSGKIDRKKLGELVFANKNLLTKLENLLHPKIENEIYKQANLLEESKKLYFVDIPIFFESNRYKEFSKVVLVYAKQKDLIERVMKRNLLTKDEVMLRLKNQIDIEKKKDLSNYVIDNSGNFGNLQSKVDCFLKELKDEYASI